MFSSLVMAGCTTHQETKVLPWEETNPIRPLPASPLGIDEKLSDLPNPPTPQTVRLGRWIFFDKRLSADASISCEGCHHPGSGFADTVFPSIGIRGQALTVAQPEGRPPVPRKAPALINEAWPMQPNFFWDGRMNSLDTLDIQPIANPLAEGSSFPAMIETLKNNGYGPYFREAFGVEEITKERVGKAIADYQRTRISGDSPWDKWKAGHDENAVSEEVKKGDELFFGKAGCVQCHFGDSFSDSRFHNIGIGWDSKSHTFKDQGRFGVTKKETDRGAFKTQGLRDISLHPPYMHDGSLSTLRDVVEHYNRGGNRNPHQDVRIHPLHLTDAEVDALVKFMEALKGEGYDDKGPSAFPQARNK